MNMNMSNLSGFQGSNPQGMNMNMNNINPSNIGNNMPNMPMGNMDLGGLGGLGGAAGNFGPQGISTPINIGTESNASEYVNLGSVISDNFQIPSSTSTLKLQISSQSASTLNNPTIELSSQVMQVTLSGDLVKGGAIDSTNKSLNIEFSCLDTAKAEFNLILDLTTNDKLSLKFTKDCEYGFFETLNRIVNIISWSIIVFFLLLIFSTVLYFYYGGSKEAYIQFIKKIINFFRTTPKEADLYDLEAGYASKYNEISPPGDTSLDQDTLERMRQIKFRQMQKETINPKFFEDKSLINSKRIKFNYEDYGGCK